MQNRASSSWSPFSYQNIWPFGGLCKDYASCCYWEFLSSGAIIIGYEYIVSIVINNCKFWFLIFIVSFIQAILIYEHKLEKKLINFIWLIVSSIRNCLVSTFLLQVYEKRFTEMTLVCQFQSTDFLFVHLSYFSFWPLALKML